MAARASHPWSTAPEKVPCTAPPRANGLTSNCIISLSIGGVLDLMTLANRDLGQHQPLDLLSLLPNVLPCIHPSILSFCLSVLCFFLPLSFLPPLSLPWTLSSSFIHSLSLTHQAVAVLLWARSGGPQSELGTHPHPQGTQNRASR